MGASNAEPAIPSSGTQDSDFTKLVQKVMDLLCEHASDEGFDQNSRQSIAKLIKYLKWIKDEKFEPCTEYLHLLEKILKNEKPSVIVVQEIIQQIRLQFWESRGWWGWLIKKFGRSAAFAMSAGAIMSSFPIAVVLFCVHSPYGAGASDLQFMDARVVFPLFLAAWIGAIVSLFSRIESFYAMTTYNPVLVFANGFLRPFLAMALAIAVLAILGSGVVSVNALNLKLTTTDNASYYSLWAIGFLSGFSERFAPDFIGRAESIFGRTK